MTTTTEYITKNEAIKHCTDFVAATPGTIFHNYPHSKIVRTADNRRTLLVFDKVYASTYKAQPELKGLFIKSWPTEVVA